MTAPEATILPSDRLFEAAAEGLSPRAKATLIIIRETCDRIDKIDGLINQPNVAREIEQRTGRSIGQTIRNNSTYRTYINQRAEESKRKRAATKSDVSHGMDQKVVIADATVRAYVEVLEAEAAQLRRTVTLLRKGVAKLRPIQPADISAILGDVIPANAPQRSAVHGFDEILTKDAIKSISVFLTPKHLGQFHCRVEDGEIVSSTEATLMGRAAVRALTAIVKRYSEQDAVPKL